MSYYANKIRSLLRCTPKEAPMIKDILRNDVLHRVALDWLTEQAFNSAAARAELLLADDRADYEEYYAGTRAITAEMLAAKAKKA